MVLSLKNELKQALLDGDYEQIAKRASNDKRTFGKLIALAYDKDGLLCWRAIEAMGAAAAAVSRTDQSKVRNVVQRILWSAREESGGMGWSAPELLAEIVIAAPQQFADIPPIIVSLHSEDEEKVFLKGVLRAIGRMGEAGITDIAGSEEIVRNSLRHHDPAVRGLAIWAAARSRISAVDVISAMTSDNQELTIYQNGELVRRSLGDLAREALAA